MISNRPKHAVIGFSLTQDERDLILRHAINVGAALKNRFHFGRRDGALLAFELSHAVFVDLLNALAHEADTAHDRAIRRSMGRLHGKLSAILDRLQGTPTEADDGPFRAAPPELREQLQKVVSQGAFDSIEDLNQALHKVTSAYNNRPREEFQGLSPVQIHKLLNTQWNSSGGALHLDHDIDFAVLRDVPMLVNARVFLAAVFEQGSVKATAAGNLNRSFVARMLESMRWPEGYLEDLRRYTKVINEEDVLSLNVLRIVLTAAGLLRRTKGAFTLTRNGKGMLADFEAGRLYAKLFHAHFRAFNLGYLDSFHECPGVQYAIAYSFYVLHRLANDWRNSKELAEKLFLPIVLEDIPPDPFGVGYANVLARRRILEPLDQFGLIECTYFEDSVFRTRKIGSLRKSPLFDRFISFDFS